MKKVFGGLTAALLAFVATVSFAQTEAPNDAQIAGIVVAANTVDINAGNLPSRSHRTRKLRPLRSA